MVQAYECGEETSNMIRYVHDRSHVVTRSVSVPCGLSGQRKSDNGSIEQKGNLDACQVM